MVSFAPLRDAKPAPRNSTPGVCAVAAAAGARRDPPRPSPAGRPVRRASQSVRRVDHLVGMAPRSGAAPLQPVEVPRRSDGDRPEIGGAILRPNAPDLADFGGSAASRPVLESFDEWPEEIRPLTGDQLEQARDEETAALVIQEQGAIHLDGTVASGPRADSHPYLPIGRRYRHFLERKPRCPQSGGP